VKHQVTKQTLLHGTVKDGIYVFPEPLFSVFANANNNVLKSGNFDIQLWHARLGHCNYNIVKTVFQNCNIRFDGCKQFCDACVIGKATQMPFKDSTTVYNSP